MCKGGEFDLSFESLTSHATRQALRELPTTDPEFFAEISQPRSCAHVAPALSPEQEALEDDPPDDELTDDSDVPFLEVCAHHHESLNPSLPQLDTTHVYIPNETGGLTSTATAEDTLVESVDGVVVDVTPQEDTLPSHRSKRNCRRNVLYSKEWWVDNRGDDGNEEEDNNDEYME